ncbi:hypothetical protein A2662_02995 [Candidatus Giovannonibacteria bacterium RIFCSPHIGHO2_01_FULL_45_33]|uniref:Uncharacterized protein n=1 Tax=Candidatus Giovannonibacteria bacterium RIFCSPLOWO2_01_FULL_45_34 TaxID=1798351 RepID=A0A1F5X1M5_9BACT|nr:MAG: hypothetical protein A2662_02995 [Candidatus Giovannonibacteria bacterium RIFCSPHIGHO2_01_FULL_45_33]OGF81799.1 MAG: hypothetical protein A2930_01385 [Candidatus Giovannonibacteria bacterium RIFCSPLOWO2_01_FULL_45_34]
MKSKNDRILEQNQNVTTLAVFIESYNKSVPEGFPKASVKSLRKFQVSYPALFKNGDDWSIDKHRKKLMDWLISNADIRVS